VINFCSYSKSWLATLWVGAEAGASGAGAASKFLRGAGAAKNDAATQHCLMETKGLTMQNNSVRC
jgi:hypothetical protein